MDENLDSFWDKDPDLIKKYFETRQDFERLCAEVSYILGKRLKENGIKYSSISQRVKTLGSFLTKIKRKNYKDPFAELTDFSGIRVICLYRDDLPKIETIIRDEFNVIEKVDKITEQGTDTFGYSAVHFTAKLGIQSSGARYDDLKYIVFEIQTRTILQDAWAIINHHLSYNHEDEVPEVLRRRLNSLVGLFETADFTFEEIRNEREKYIQDVQDKSINEHEFLSQKINLDTLTAYTEWKFSGFTIDKQDYLSKLINDLKKNEYYKLKDIDNIVNITAKVRETVSTKKKLVPKNDAITQIRLALVLGDEDYMWNCYAKPMSIREIDKYAIYKDEDSFNQRKRPYMA